jgi:hypothetical protein
MMHHGHFRIFGHNELSLLEISLNLADVSSTRHLLEFELVICLGHGVLGRI